MAAKLQTEGAAAAGPKRPRLGSTCPETPRTAKQLSLRNWASCSPQLSGSERVRDFYDFMLRREALRRRKELQKLPPEQWTDDPVMARIRLTNVRREDDRTTRVMRRLGNVYVQHHPELQALHLLNVPEWDPQLRRAASLLVFNFGLWRAFGTDTFAKAVGFVTSAWTEEIQEQVVEKAVESWLSGKFNYTDAYDPCRSNRQTESQASSVFQVRSLYKRTCANLCTLWQACEKIAEVAVATNSWESVTKCIMKVRGYGGTGFLAKELTQDLLHTPLFGSLNQQQSKWVTCCRDLNSWCAVGPGARRGINRLYGREVDQNAYGSDQKSARQFLDELQDIFGQRELYWGGDLEGLPLFDLELHDVQFQLCEFDKYEREKTRTGQVRPYVPRC